MRAKMHHPALLQRLASRSSHCGLSLQPVVVSVVLDFSRCVLREQRGGASDESGCNYPTQRAQRSSPQLVVSASLRKLPSSRDGCKHKEVCKPRDPASFRGRVASGFRRTRSIRRPRTRVRRRNMRSSAPRSALVDPAPRGGSSDAQNQESQEAFDLRDRAR